MKGLTNYITECLWVDILIATFVLVDDAHQKLNRCFVPNRKHTPGGGPTFSDSEVIAISLFGEMVFTGAEDKTLHFIRQYHLDLFPQLPDNSRFNRRKRCLVETMEAIRCYLRDCWQASHPQPQDVAHLRLVDSAPVPICTYTRGSRCQSVPIDWRDEWFGVCASKKTKFFGARCHITTTLDQMIDTWLLAPGSYDDRKPLVSLLEERQGLGVIGDKGYVGADLEDRLWEVGDHLLLALKRKNQKIQWPAGIQKLLGKLRHSVETAFSVLTTVFHLDKPGSRSFSGFLVRMTTKILAHTVSYFLAETLTPQLGN
jgi:hypothetical protein